MNFERFQTVVGEKKITAKKKGFSSEKEKKTIN